MDLTRWLCSLSIHLDVAGANCRGGQRTGPVEADGPKPQIESHGKPSMGSGRFRGDATLAKAKELESMSDPGEAMLTGQGLFQLGWKTLLHLDDQCAARTDQVVMVPVTSVRNQFEARRSITEVVSSDESHLLQRVKIPIDGRQIAALVAQCRMDFPVGQRVLVTPEDLQDGLPWARDFSGVLPQLGGQLPQGWLNQPMEMRMRCAALAHDTLGDGRFERWRQRPAIRAATNRALAVTTIEGPPGRLNWKLRMSPPMPPARPARRLRRIS